MDYLKFISAILAAQTAHTGGHFNVSSDSGIESSLHGGSEHYENPSKAERDLPTQEVVTSFDGKKVPVWRMRKSVVMENQPLFGPKAVDIHGGGFSMQDEIARAADDPYYHAASALVKLFHLLGGPEGMSRDIRKNSGGDLAAMKKESGNKHVPEMVAASAIFDAMKARGMDKDGSLSFTTLDQGVPALVYSRRF